MRLTNRFCFIGASAFALGCPVVLQAHSESQEQGIEAMRKAAERFLRTLDEGQRGVSVFGFPDGERKNWHYVPAERAGVLLKDLDAGQKHLAYALLSSGLSQRGLVQATAIMALEKVLADLGGDPTYRDTEKYTLAIFGEPSVGGTWGWRFEGHHLSLNFTVADGKRVAVTPSFYGSNPGEVESGPYAGIRVLGGEEDMARSLGQALKKSGKPVVFSEKPPREILTKQERKVEPLKVVGVPVAEMDSSQESQFWKVVEQNVRRHRGAFADVYLAELHGEDPRKIRFAWAGSLEKGRPHYYRVQAAAFLIEFANTQNGANHAHSVLRSFEGDFGEDLLADHYRENHGSE